MEDKTQWVLALAQMLKMFIIYPLTVRLFCNVPQSCKPYSKRTLSFTW
jgi:hypothetical protein